MGDKETFPFVKPPSKWMNNGGVELLYKDSRWYVERGPANYFKWWLEEIQQGLKGNLIPLQWVPDFVGVSRAGVLKRAKKGGLTIMSFIMITESTTILGGTKDRDSKKRYDYAIISECKYWREELSERVEKKGGN